MNVNLSSGIIPDEAWRMKHGGLAYYACTCSRVYTGCVETGDQCGLFPLVILHLNCFKSGSLNADTSLLASPGDPAVSDPLMASVSSPPLCCGYMCALPHPACVWISTQCSAPVC